MLKREVSVPTGDSFALKMLLTILTAMVVFSAWGVVYKYDDAQDRRAVAERALDQMKADKITHDALDHSRSSGANATSGSASGADLNYSGYFDQGAFQVNGNTTLGDSSSDTVTINGNLIVKGYVALERQPTKFRDITIVDGHGTANQVVSKWVSGTAVGNAYLDVD